MNKKNNKAIRYITTVLIIIVLFCLGIFIYSYSQLNKIKSTKLPEEEAAPKETPVQVKDGNGKDQNAHKVTNILFLGVDKLENASDSIMILSLDDSSKTVKMTSIMRDSYVFFGKDKINKINYAYHYGGPALSVKTVNDSFNMDIKDYIKVDFAALHKIIDSLGGIDIDIKKEEIDIINFYIRDIATIEKITPQPVTKAGLQRLSGLQAVAYTRIRYVGNQDYERTERQRRVLKLLFEKVKDVSLLSLPSIASNITPYLETSLDKGEMLSLGSKLISYGKKTISESRVPYDGYKSDAMINDIYYMKWDRDKNIELLHKFIYLD